MHSVFYGTKRAVAMMRETGNGGNIINISSISGIVGIPGNVAYSAAKAGVRLMTKTVAMETAKENIRVNSIHPGLIDTNFLPAQNRKMLKTGICLSKLFQWVDWASRKMSQIAHCFLRVIRENILPAQSLSWMVALQQCKPLWHDYG